MTRALVLRPEPDNAATCARLAARGVAAVGAPLFEIVPVAWQPPPAAALDTLLLTSANAVRHAGAGLRAYAGLPVIAVGAATADAARVAGLQVRHVGDGDAAAALASAAGARVLHLAGRHRRALPGVQAVTVYESVARSLAPEALAAARGGVVLLHSARAARCFAALVPAAQRGRVALSALSAAVADAAGTGWRLAVAAPQPTDALLVALAAETIDRLRPGIDKPVP